MTKQIVIAGGGIGGLSAALACSRAGWPVQLMEFAPEFNEVGAGIQLGPNVVRVLHGWGLGTDLSRLAAYPERLQARSIATGAELGVLRLGERTRRLYGAPHATIHRADLHHVLLKAVRKHPLVQIHMHSGVESFVQTEHGVHIAALGGLELEGEALIGADGLWSRVRQKLLNDARPRVTGHLAYRAMVPQQSLPERLRSQHITVWMGPKMHVVQYPVRRGQWLNVVAIVQGRVAGNIESWDHSANGKDLQALVSGACRPLQDVVAAIANWRLWPLCDRPPMQGAHEQAQGRVALLGDAAHPMRPYMAQGAGMAIEDAACLEQVLAPADLSMGERLQRYAEQRWQRNARVQARSIRNGKIFHAWGPVRWGRDLAMGALGERLMDVPWLYNGPTDPSASGSRLPTGS